MGYLARRPCALNGQFLDKWTHQVARDIAQSMRGGLRVSTSLWELDLRPIRNRQNRHPHVYPANVFRLRARDTQPVTS